MRYGTVVTYINFCAYNMRFSKCKHFDLQIPSSAEFKNAWNYISTPHTSS